jgi:membrane protein DedA with SNARE-associated domain
MQGFLESHAIYAIVIFGVLEAMCIPISSELTFLVGGAVASGAVAGTTQHPSLALVIVVGTLAELVGSFIAYGIGRAGGRPLVRRAGKYVLVTQHDVDRAERFLVGRGAWALPVARMLPFIRAFASIVAGIVDVPPVRFAVLNLIGTVAYVVALSSIGYSLGSEWSKFNKTFSDASYVVVGVILIALVAIVLHRLRTFRKESTYAAKHGGTSQVGPDKQRSGHLQAEVGKLEDRAVRQAPPGDRRAGTALHEDRDSDHLGPRRLQRVHGGQHRVAGGGGVLHGEHPPSGDVGTLDPALQAVGFLTFSHDEGVDRSAAVARGGQHRVRDGVGAEGQPAHCVVGQVGGGFQQQPARQGRQSAVEKHSPKVDVGGRTLPGGEHEIPVQYALLLDGSQQQVTIVHGGPAYRQAPLNARNGVRGCQGSLP